MPRPLRFLAVAIAAAAMLAVPLSAAAAPASTTFTVTGFEYAFTPAVGFFAGSAIGNAGERGAWNTHVEHDRLGSEPPIYVTGGSFRMATRGSAGAYDWVTGTFVYHGGTITTIDPGAGCTNQRYLVTGTLENVSTRTTAGGSGTFSVTLTHYRAPVLGRCITYSASVAGTVSFQY
ncbi:hypothetical protein BH18ACT12_BH18ACT12_15270 [soil metagenome]